MEVANVRLRLNKVGSNVPLTDVTPAEAMFLHIIHGPSNGGHTFGELGQDGKFPDMQIVGTAKVVAKPATPEQKDEKTGEVIEEAVPAVLRDRTDAEELRRLAAKYSNARTKENKPILDTVWPDKFNPKLPQTFKELNWQEIGATSVGIESAAVNYATGGLAKTL